jgi:hypothetical protein
VRENEVHLLPDHPGDHVRSGIGLDLALLDERILPVIVLECIAWLLAGLVFLGIWWGM